MEAPLALICIIFMVCITYGVIRATNIQKNHGLACRTIYIPEDLSIKTLLNQIKDLSNQNPKHIQEIISENIIK